MYIYRRFTSGAGIGKKAHKVKAWKMATLSATAATAATFGNFEKSGTAEKRRTR